MVAAIVAVVLVGCKKEKETPKTETNDSNVQRKPIAVFDNNSELITTFINTEAVNKKLKESFFVHKDNANRFVVESVEVLDSVPHNKDVKGEIKFTILDTEEECSYSIWCMKGYVVKDVKEQQVDYYLDENVENGNYDFAFKEGNTYYAADFVGDSLSIHEIDSLDFGCRIRILFICKSENCGDQCSKAGSWYSNWCRICRLPNGKCREMGIIEFLFDYLF